ncbi:hypothetical protein ACSQ67_001403 [Phaseolus vulgaris]
MLLRNRSRAVSKPGLMADHSSQQSPTQNYAKTIPSLFGSPKFRDFTNKCLSSGTEALRSPTSILDARALSPSAFGNPFLTLPYKISPPSRTSWDKPDSKGLRLALVDALKDDDNPIHDNSEPNKGNVLLRVKIPFESQTCADDFGTKTKDSKTHRGQKFLQRMIVLRQVGEKAFCSRKCRHQEMVLDGIENSEFESNGFS